MNTNQIWGRLTMAKAKVKELAGTLAGNHTLISEAHAEFAAGRTQAEFGDAKAVLEKRRLARRRGRLGHAR